jgi:lipopolysaccharide/colanic/teichoic acid biosynthesis glycosyltransferase
MGAAAVQFSSPNNDAATLALVDFEPTSSPSTSEKLTRLANVSVALVGLIVLLPLMALVALAIWLNRDGPILYSQVRVGEDRRNGPVSPEIERRRHYDHGGRLFRMYKFRTMRVDAEANGRAVWAQRGDSRVTSIGRILRVTRLDELPQLYNVLRGDMNVVGPRPERPSIFAELRETIPGYAARQQVKPGITGWAQINQSYDSCMDDVRRKVQFDLEYVGRRSVAHDLRIMSMTVPVMLLRKGGW